MNPKHLDCPLLSQLVDRCGYQDIVEELRRRDGIGSALRSPLGYNSLRHAIG